MFIVDTHSLIWYLTGNEKLSDTAETLLKQADSGEIDAVIPTIVLAEALFISEKTGAEFNSLLEKVESGSNYQVYPLNIRIIKKMKDIEEDYSIHDKVIAATSKILEAEIITGDEELREGKANTIW
ncbi:MAG: type II toxin-antitoxin system VapC family toxin [Candidatus Nanohaloarchaea archaeon]